MKHLLVLLILLVASTVSATITERQIQDLIDNKLPLDAQTALLPLDQNNPFVIYYMARTEQNADTAITKYNRILQQFSQHEIADDALYELAQYNYAMGFYMTAARQYEKLTNTYPHSPHAGNAMYWGAASYLAVRQPAKSRELYERYLGKFTTLNEEVQLGIGDSYFIEKEFEQALRSYQFLVTTYATGELVATALAKIAECYTILGRDDKAAEFALKIKEVSPESFPAIQVADPQPSSGYVPPPVLEEPASADYIIQVGSFTQQDNARTMSDQLIAKQYPAQVAVNIINATQYYRVWVGPFETKDSAKETAVILKEKENIDYIIKTK